MNSAIPRATARTARQPEFGLNDELLSLRPKAVWKAFFAEHFAFIAIAVYLLLEYLKLDQSYPIFSILPLIRLSLIAAIIGYFADKQAKFVRSPLNWLLVLFLLHCAASSALAYQPAYSFERFSVIGTWVIVYFLVTGIVSTERRLFLFVLIYFLANFKMSQFGFFSWVSRGFGFASWGITGAGWFRNSGELGLEMSMFFAFTVCLAFHLRKYWHGWVKWLMYFMPVTALACVIASSSRGAIVGVVGVVFYLSFFSKRKLRAWTASAVLLFLAYLMMPAQFLERFQKAGNDPTSLTRIEYWTRAWELLQQNPYFGIGYYNWLPYYRDHFFNPSLYWRVEEAHNTYLQMGAELGYIGLAIFVCMVAVSFRINWKSASLCKEEGMDFLRGWALGMNAAGLGMILASVFLTAFFMPNYWIHFAFTVCLSNVVQKKIQAKHVAASGRGMPVASRGSAAKNAKPAPATSRAPRISA